MSGYPSSDTGLCEIVGHPCKTDDNSGGPKSDNGFAHETVLLPK